MKRDSYRGQSGVSGMSLVSVLIAISLTGFLALLLSTLAQNQMSAQRNSDQLAQRAALLVEISKALADSPVCLASLGTFNPSVPSNTQIIASLVSNFGIPLYGTGNSYGNGLIKINRMELRDPLMLSAVNGRMTLRITFEKNSTTTFQAVGGTTKNQDLTVFFTVNPVSPGTIISCSTSPTSGAGISTCSLRYSTAATAAAIPAGAYAVALCSPGEFAVNGGLLVANGYSQSSYPYLNAQGKSVGWVGGLAMSGIIVGASGSDSLSAAASGVYYGSATGPNLTCFPLSPSGSTCLSTWAMCCP